ncbi:DUF6445 family protein [Sphingomonas mollis]|uniref:EthD domain-containing protein n=1 Tax=Sphingomonas mollis TaxID=2795726 RepID=A0ABS0XL45_9SPHN|nr:DUF6445 family protein [Sphingomonas sp. BT553]MBJ6120752.1 hypothetical protein [Sphingomonas sp. BT553]
MTGPRVLVREMGNEREPVAIIDNFAADPDALRAFAAMQEYAPAGRHYPGIMAPLPDDYLRRQGPLIAMVLREVFGAIAEISVLEARFSIVTVAPASLSIEQRLPHVDALEPGRLALIHYLVPGGTDGTAFYRHRATGFETVDATRGPAYFAALHREIESTSLPNAYIAADTPMFERTGHVDGAYNRALLYRSRVLHSGAISPDAVLPADPGTGRLTVTGFFAA